MLRATAVVASCALLSACVSTESTAEDLKAHPIHDVKVGLPAPGVCDWNQKMGRHYTAIDNETGKPVKGVLCTNLFESYSITVDDYK